MHRAVLQSQDSVVGLSALQLVLQLIDLIDKFALVLFHLDSRHTFFLKERLSFLQSALEVTFFAGRMHLHLIDFRIQLVNFLPRLNVEIVVIFSLGLCCHELLCQLGFDTLFLVDLPETLLQGHLHLSYEFLEVHLLILFLFQLDFEFLQLNLVIKPALRCELSRDFRVLPSEVHDFIVLFCQANFNSLDVLLLIAQLS